MQAIKQFFKTHPHAWWGAYLPVYLAMFFTIEHFITDNYWATQTVLDTYIPFCEWFIFPYVSWSPLLVVFCILVPNGQDLRPAVMAHHNAATWLVEYTYSIDTNTNVFPSVHILGCMAAVAAVWHTPGLRKPGWRWGVTLYAILIMAATVFVKQHAAIDVLAGLLTGAALFCGLFATAT